jgi:hypothetical protein
MKRRLVALAISIGWLSGTSWADPPPLQNVAATRKLADAAMALIADDKIHEAMALLRPYWPIKSAEIDVAEEKTISTRNAVADRFGQFVGVSFVREDDVSDFLIRYIYVEKREHHILRWIFIFYRPKDVWVLNAELFDDNIQAFFTK